MSIDSAPFGQGDGAVSHADTPQDSKAIDAEAALAQMESPWTSLLERFAEWL